MYEVTRESTFSAAHHLREYKGKCEAIHGHNWRVRVSAEAEVLDHAGMVVDFKVLGEHLEDVLARFDHADLNETPPFDTLNPSSENVARHIFAEMSARINDGRVRISRVMVWETDPSCATYYE